MKNQFLQCIDRPTYVKICGLMDEECVDVAVGAGADAIGFVFAEGSPRQIDRDHADLLCTQLPEEVTAVAVLQNYPNLSDFSDWNGWLQLCGDEDEDEVATASCPVIRAFKWNERSLRRWDACPNVEAILADGSSGGQGKQFDVSMLAKLVPALAKPVIVAGGLHAQNVEEVIRSVNPAAVDVSSGVESSLGVKDPKKICTFINTVKGFK